MPPSFAAGPLRPLEDRSNANDTYLPTGEKIPASLTPRLIAIS